MIRTEYAISASRVIRDANDNRVSAIDLLDDFPSQGFPLVFPRTSILWVLTRGPDDPPQPEGFSIRILLNDVLLQEFPVQINFQDQRRTRSIILIAGIVINAPGRLSFAFKREGVEAPDAIYSIEITAAPVVVGQEPAQRGGVLAV